MLPHHGAATICYCQAVQWRSTNWVVAPAVELLSEERWLAGMWSGMMWPIYTDLSWFIHIVLQCFIQCFTYDLHVGFVFVMWPFKLGALIASWFLDREPGFGIAWVRECINRFASGIHWDWWLRWGPRVWVLQMVLSSCCRCELLDDLFTIDTWGQNLTTKCFPQFHRFVHPEVVYHRWNFS